jgi:hypothetical protein
MAEARGSRSRAPGAPVRAPRRAPPRSPGPSPGAAHLRRRGAGEKPALTEQCQGHGQGAGRPLAGPRAPPGRAGSPHRRAHTSGGAGRAGCPRGAEGEAAGGDARGRCKKKLGTRYCGAHRDEGRPASRGRAGTCRCHLETTGSGRADGRTCEAGAVGRARRSGGRRGGAVVAATATLAGSPRRGALTPHPAASQTPSCDSVSHKLGRRASSRLPLRRPGPVRSHGNGRAQAAVARSASPCRGRSGPRPPLEPPAVSGAGCVFADIPAIFLNGT